VRSQEGMNDGIRQCRKGMVRRPQQDAAQPDDVARDWKGNDLTPTIGQCLEATGPTGLEDERFVFGLPLPRELLATAHVERMPLQVCQALQLVTRQGQKCVQLLGQYAVGLRVRHDPTPLKLGATCVGKDYHREQLRGIKIYSLPV